MMKNMPAPTHSISEGMSNQRDHAMNANTPAADKYKNVDSRFPNMGSSFLRTDSSSQFPDLVTPPK